MIRLEDTSGGAVAAAIAEERRRIGSPATGMVLTMLVLADEESQSDATSAAVGAARQHPMRILTLIPRSGKDTRLDAEIAVAGEDGPGEVAVLRLRGELANYGNSVAVPLLLPDTPVVAFWPHGAPAVPADDLIGRHAQRRITDLAAEPDPIAALAKRKSGYRPGDTDLAWTRLTPWRSALAGALDQPLGQVTSASVFAEDSNASAVLLATWLNKCLHVSVDLVSSSGPGITEVRLETHEGALTLSRPEGDKALLTRPGAPDSAVALPRRELASLLAEDLRRLDPDEVYGEVIASVST
ncbi:MAG: glucose-6-phosphate dehydrogenase assembly protein OpcA [Actinomycetes bacterium]|jgi:glucose-6-phosphate dehydrogenase assembly protein OpcA